METTITRSLLRSSGRLAASLMVAAAAGTVMATAEPAAAARTCIGSLKNTTVSGDLYVPAGSTCTAYGVDVHGSIQVARGATLRFSTGDVDSDVQGESAPHTVSVYNSTVEGDVQAKSARYVKVQGSVIGGDAQVEKNRYWQRIYGNTIGGNLDCTENNPAPVGSGNRVYGSKTGQCRGL